MPNPSFTLNKRIGTAKAKEITTVEDFVEGYRSREDTSLLKPQTLVSGSHDVLVGNSGRIRSREGYYMDGAQSSVVSVTRPLADWEMGTGFIHHLRAGGLTSVGNNGQLQIRYTDTYGALGAVNGTYWLPLLTGLTSTYFQSTNYWDTTNLLAKLLLVNRTGTIWEWTGGIGTIASVTSNTITLNGTMTLQQLKFYSSGYVINNGVVYQYGSISGQTLILLPTSPSPVGSTMNSPIYQQPVSFTFANATFGAISPGTGGTPAPASNFTCDLIALLQNSNQVLVASITNNIVYLSQAGTYTNYSQSTTGSPAGARLQYEGDMLTTIGNVTAFSPQENSIYVSAGLDEWYLTQFTETTITNSATSATFTFENAQLAQIKTTSGQASISQYSTFKIANDIVFISNEPIIKSLGRVANVLTTPQMTDLSFPIVNDMDLYNFSDASGFYFKEKAYIAIPASGVVVIYNMTNPKAPFWEAPQYLPVSGFCAVGNTLIGHSYNTFESYVMFQGYSDRALTLNSVGDTINAVAIFAMQGMALRAKRKSFNKFFVEGYITPGTVLTVGLIFRAPGNGLTPGQTVTITGTGNGVLTQVIDDGLGKQSLGKDPLGGDLLTPQQMTLPPYFATIPTMTRNPYLAYQPMFSSTGVSQRWELLSYGNNASPTSENETDITN